MSHIEELRIIVQRGKTKFEDIVNDYLAQGWELHGSVFVYKDDFVQAVIKLKERG